MSEAETQAAQMTPPDSDAREVCKWQLPATGGRCQRPLHHDGPHEPIVAEYTMTLPLPLAQRILAALQTTGVAMWRADLLALADELRAVIGK